MITRTVIFTCLLFARPATAYHGLEIQTPLGVTLTSPSALNEGRSEKIQARELVTFGADLLYIYEGWGAGVRFDSISSYKMSGGEILEVGSRLFSLLGRYHWEANGLLWGPTVSVGVYQNSDASFLQPAAAFQKYKAGRGQNASAGAQLQWLKDVYVLGTELGYQHLILGSFTESQGARLATPSGSDVEADLSGPYLKLLLGVRL